MRTKHNILLLFTLITLSVFSQIEMIDRNEQKFIFNYFEAEKFKIVEEYDQALSMYEKCIAINSLESAPYNEIAKIYFYREQWSEAEYYIQKAIDLDPTNIWYYYLIIDLYSLQGKFNEQIKIYSDLIKKDPTNYGYHLHKIKLLKETKEYKSALKYINKTKKTFGEREDLLIEMQDIYLLQENKDLAIKTGLHLIEKNPTNVSYYGMLASIYMRFSDYNNAIEVYQKLLLINPNSPTAQVALYQIFLNRKDLKNQSKHLLNIAKNEAIPLVTKKEIFYDILLNQNLADYPFLKEIIQNCNTLYPEEQLFKVLLGDLYFNEGSYNKSLAFYENALNTGLVKDQYIYHKIIEICFQQDEYDKLITFSDLAISLFPVIPEFYYYKSLGLMQIKDYQGCLSSLLKGEEFVIDNRNLYSDFFSLIGDCYHYLNNDVLSDVAYKNSLEQNPENIFVLNNFSYYLSLRGDSLDLALEMVIKCDSLTKNNPNASFLDTYSWVLYQLKEYHLAKEISEKALIISPNNLVIIEHYGDILFQLELNKKAMVQWQKAYQMDNTNINLKQKIDNNHSDE